jgi:DNA mismatch repair ATPase MutS
VPLLFLIDEMLPGTNSHDRRVGAEAIIRRLLDRDAVGLVTTHDLALTDIVSELGPVALNVHFEDRLESGRMTFDYQLRPGVVRRSNALELLKLVGLTEVASQTPTASGGRQSPEWVGLTEMNGQTPTNA